MQSEGDETDSQRRETGGSIPGAPGIPAFVASVAAPSSIPLLIAVPHAGRAYPRALLRDMRHAEAAALKLEDRYVDRLAIAVAREVGASLVVAQAPRAMIDLNRAPDDLDWEMFAKADRPLQSGLAPSRRARSGLGLIPRRLPGLGEIWRRRQNPDDLDARITQVHEPYHARIARDLLDLRTRWGAALLVDLHSMPPLVAGAAGFAPRYVVGDRFGGSCHGSLTAAAFSYLHEAGAPVSHNRPYAGGYVLERHAAPMQGIHALQLEIDRSTYLDSRMVEPGSGFDGVVTLLVGLARRLAQEVSQLGQSGSDTLRQAAE
ncbi:N-formylglutamate amidohydrolase [Novosphingobium aquimarinum]|uniref:N-formylglutamate amidohydrolase n=1 Tax=Novosphingobium aquimarinum TaxID=2682494 RepID=UPI0012EB2C19|nr:N-formylglutamate amidohydrolase [Novosphingobium aquimarinum]